MEQLNQYTPGAGLLSTAGNLVGIGIQGIINRRAERRSWNRNVKMWHMQNEYNSPVQQMQRLNDAGLNPNLMYGKGTVGNAQSSPTYTALPPQGMGDMFGKSLAGIQGIMSLYQQKQAIEDQTLDLWLKTNTSYAKLEQEFALTGRMKEEEKQAFYKTYGTQIENRINEIKLNFWEQGISPTDSIWLRGAIQLADKLNIQALTDALKSLPVQVLNEVGEKQFKEYRRKYYSLPKELVRKYMGGNND